MKRYLILSIIYCFAMGISALDISFLENFALKDKEETLKELIPNSEEYYYFKCIFLQEEGKFEEVEKILKNWGSEYTGEEKGKLYNVIMNRQALLSYSKNPGKTYKYLNRHYFSEDKKLKYAITSERISSIKESSYIFSEKELDQPGIIEKLTEEGLRQIPLEKISLKNAEFYLTHSTIADIPNAYKLVLKYPYCLKHLWWNQLDLSNTQINKCLKENSSLINYKILVKSYLRNLRYKYEDKIQSNPEIKEEYIRKVWDFVKKLNNKFRLIKVNTLYFILKFNATHNKYDKQLFQEFLKGDEGDYLANSASSHENLLNEFINSTIINSNSEIKKLKKHYLIKFYDESKNELEFISYFDVDFLSKIYAEYRIQNGIENSQDYSDIFTQNEYLDLKNKVTLSFRDKNKRYYKPAEEVKLTLNIKNIDKLFVRIYRINQVNYYQIYKQEVPVDIDITGLVPKFEKVYKYNNSPFRIHKETFSFPELNQRGEYLIEFIGNNKISRALIRKGYLKYFYKITAGGYIFNIFNEKSELLKKASVFINGIKYTSDNKGNIQVPFAEKKKNYQAIILFDGETAMLKNFKYLKEKYKLTADYIYNRENFLKQKKAALIISPSLKVSDSSAPLSLLKNIQLEIIYNYTDGTTSTEIIKGIKFYKNKDTVCRFYIPELVTKIELKLKADIENLTLKKKETLSCSKMIIINQIENDTIKQVFLKRNGDKYFAELRSKDGNLLPDTNLEISLYNTLLKRSARINAPKKFFCKSDSKGRVDLGSLKNISVLKAEINGKIYIFQLNNKREYINLKVQAGKPFAIAVNSRISTPPDYKELSFLSNDFTNMIDHISYNNRQIHIAPLPEGEYSLKIFKDNLNINITAYKGIVKKGLLHNDEYITELSDTTPLQITDISEIKDKLIIKLENYNKNTRVHIIPTYFDYSQSLYENSYQNSYFLQTVKCRIPESFYQAEQPLSDEYKYIINRKSSKIYPGNMLQRPQFLLNPCRNNNFPTLADMPSSFGGRSGNGRRSGLKRYGGRGRAMKISGNANHTVDFLADQSPVIANLTPDKNGEISVPLSKFLGRQNIYVVALNSNEKASMKYVLKSSSEKINLRDLRAKISDKDIIESAPIDTVKVIRPGEKFLISDSETGQFKLFTSLKDIFDFYNTVLKNKEFSKFKFLTNWNKLSLNEKLKKYSKYACHEVNYFIYKKDKNFFNKYIAPYLQNKLHKTFIDDYLLNINMNKYKQVYFYHEKLNLFEKILLTKNKMRSKLISNLKSIYKKESASKSEWNYLFLTALRTLNSEISENDNDESVKSEKSDRNIKVKVFNTPEEPVEPEEEETEEIIEIYVVDDETQIEEDIPEQLTYINDDNIRLLRKKLSEKELKNIQPGPPQVYVENNYYNYMDNNKYLIPVNKFWIDYAENSSGKFLSDNFICASNSLNEALLALAVLDIPFNSTQIKRKSIDNQIEFSATDPFIICCRHIEKIKNKNDEKLILMNMKYFQKTEKSNHTKTIQNLNEFKNNTIYGCSVFISNPMNHKQNFNLYLQIPEGAIPVKLGFYSKTLPVNLKPHSSIYDTYYFYFPEGGTFKHPPVMAIKDKKLIASSEEKTLIVKNIAPSTLTRSSWKYIAKNGTADEVISFLKTKNFDLNLNFLIPRMKDKEFYKKIIKTLSENMIYDSELFAYSVYHKDNAVIKDFLSMNSNIDEQFGPYLKSPLLDIDPYIYGIFEYQEFNPYINRRCCTLSVNKKINTPLIEKQYRKFLYIICHKKTLSDIDYLTLIYYLLLQDRADEGIKIFEKINPANLSCSIQYDYLKAYIAFYKEDVDTAYKTAINYKEYPIYKWREKFNSILDQIRVINNSVNSSENIKEGRNSDLENINFEVKNSKINILYNNIEKCTVNYYPIDLELLFSNAPFENNPGKQLSVLEPVKKQIFTLPHSENKLGIKIPENLKNRNLLIELTGAGRKIYKTYSSNNLRIDVNQYTGELQVTDKITSKPLSKVYIKIYAKLKSGERTFYKDGYSDLRGRFNYISLNSNLLNKVDIFSILILSEQNGAEVIKINE